MSNQTSAVVKNKATGVQSMTNTKTMTKQNNSEPVNRKITLGQLIGLSIAFFGSIRNVPQVASAGISSILWMILSVIIFVIPMGFIAAELATGWSKRGGPEVWVKEAFGRRPGFLVAWLLWVQMFFGMVIISVGFATMIAYVFGDPIVYSYVLKKNVNLSGEPMYLLGVVVGIYWILTVLNIFYKKAGSSLINIGAIIGIYIPFVCLVLFGGIFMIQVAVNGDYELIGNISSDFIPPSTGGGVLPESTNGLQLFSQIMWIFIGLEIASTRANEINNPKKNYSLALLIVLILMVVFNLAAGFIFAAIVPSNEIFLQNAVITPFQKIFAYWKVPGLTSVFALLMAFGMFSQLNSWILGPSNSMYATACDGTMPKFFHKKNKNDIPIVFVIIQAIAVSVFAALYSILIIVNASNVFGILLNETIIIYCIAYLLMISAYIRLKYTRPDVKRGFVVPFKKTGAWITTILATIGVTLAIILTFFQDQNTVTLLIVQDVVVYIGITMVFISIPLLISLSKGFKQNKWFNAEDLKNEQD